MSDKLPVTYWSDPLCIWAYLAQDKLERMFARYGDRLAVRYRVVPVFGSVPWRFTQGSWAEAGPEGRAAKTREIAARFGHDEVSGRVWVDDPPATTWSPSAAIKAVAQAEEEGAVPEGSTGSFQHHLRVLFFAEDRNVACRPAQAEAARRAGLDWSTLIPRLDDGRALAGVWEDHVARESAGVQGSPTWVFDGGRSMLYGNVSEGVLHATIEQLLEGATPGSSRCG